MLIDLRIFFLKRIFDQIEHLMQFLHLLLVNASPVFSVHDIKKAPEYFLLVLDMH